MRQLGFEPEQQLCLDLLHADTEQEVIDILKKHGYWDNPDVWVAYGGKEGNAATFGNQSDNPEAALAEKLVNSVDAVLMGECGAAGIDPNSPQAPTSIPEAVATFIHNDASKANTLGYVSYWSDQKRREIANRITLAATGSPSNPSITIVDSGEGQTPESMPDTLLSLYKENKDTIHFVQGKFNMGGTAAVRFCGQNRLQLIISKRNPGLKQNDLYFNQWGFTLVRREYPRDGRKLSTYTYLAPHERGILRFEADYLPLFPHANKAYVRDTKWGTAIKLYEYKATGRSHILRKGGLLQRLEILLPEVALPIRLHECRDYFKGHTGSFDNTLTGLCVRLKDGHKNLEHGFPTSGRINTYGEDIPFEVYAFKSRKAADAYKRSEGVIFTVNGQTQGIIPRGFFGSNAVKMGRLEDSLLVILDCSGISWGGMEDLFMNSRDRLEQGEFLKNIKEELALLLRDHADLRALRERRRSEDVEAKLKDSKPFTDALESMIRKSPSLAAHLGLSGRLPNAFKPNNINRSEKFAPKLHPSYFRFQNKDYGHVLERTTPINMRSRITFETDVVQDYFRRRENPGEYELYPTNGGSTPGHSLNLQSGAAILNLNLPSGANFGDSFVYDFTVQDETRVDPFVNQFIIKVGQYQKPSGGGGGTNHNHKTPPGLAMPTSILVHESEWYKHGFDKHSALRVIHDPSDKEDDPGSHVYYINMDNTYLRTELKTTKESPAIIKARWRFGLVIIGMVLLKEETDSATSLTNGQIAENYEEVSVVERVGKAAKAIAPALLPLIEHLGVASVEDAGN